MTSPGQAASLGPTAGQEALAAVLAGVPEFALTQGSARPSASPVEVDADGYARQAFAWDNSDPGYCQNDTAASWALPDGTEVGGVAVLDATHTTLEDPLAWVELGEVVTIADGRTFDIPVGGVAVQGYGES
jgi:hypothetical protein